MITIKIACRMRTLQDSAARRNEAAVAQLRQNPSLLSSGHGAASLHFLRASSQSQPIETSAAEPLAVCTERNFSARGKGGGEHPCSGSVALKC